MKSGISLSRVGAVRILCSPSPHPSSLGERENTGPFLETPFRRLESGEETGHPLLGRGPVRGNGRRVQLYP